MSRDETTPRQVHAWSAADPDTGSLVCLQPSEILTYVMGEGGPWWVLEAFSLRTGGQERRVIPDTEAQTLWGRLRPHASVNYSR